MADEVISADISTRLVPLCVRKNQGEVGKDFRRGTL